MHIKTVLLFLTIFLFSIVSVYAIEEYPQVGLRDGTFATGLGFFNEGMVTDFIAGTATLSDPKNIPLVVDLDGDGVSEIIVIDGDQIKLFNNITLQPVSSYTSVNNEDNLQIYAFDYDGDGIIELIVSGVAGTSEVEILEYNGTSIIQEQSFELDGHMSGQSMVACKAVEQCAIVYPRSNTAIDPNNLNIQTFNSSGKQQKTTYSTATQLHCLPRIPHLATADVDDDGTIEYIVSSGRKDTIGPFGTFTHLIHILDAPMASPAIVETTINLGSYTGGGGTDDCTTSNYDLSFSPPLVADLDGFPNSLEIAIAHMVSLTDLKIEVFNPNGGSFDSFPNIFNSDGQLVSNLVLTDIFDDTGETDLCALGYSSSTNQINMICGNKAHSRTVFTIPFGILIVDNEQFIYDVEPGLYNLSDIFSGSPHEIITHIIHSSDMKIGDTNKEIINTYGVFDTTFDLRDFISAEVRNDMNLIYRSPKGEAVILPIDYERVGREDLLILTNTNLFYNDDGFINQPATITEYTINPCVDSTWKINTTVSVNIKVEDPELNTVQSRAQLYFDSLFAIDSGLSVNGSSGTEFNFGFVANETIGAGVLRLTGIDSEENPSIPDNIDVTFSVASQGVEFGDCITTVVIDVEAIENGTGLGGVDLNNNAITKTINEMDDFTGLGSTILWVLFMAVVAFGMFVRVDSKIVIPAVIIVESLFLIVGTILGFVPLGFLIAIVIVMMAVVFVFVWRSWTGSDS